MPSGWCLIITEKCRRLCSISFPTLDCINLTFGLAVCILLFVQIVALTFVLASLQSTADRLKFFENYARDHNFDPLSPRNWYAHKERIMNVKVTTPQSFSPTSIITYHRILEVSYGITIQALLRP